MYYLKLLFILFLSINFIDSFIQNDGSLLIIFYYSIVLLFCGIYVFIIFFFYHLADLVKSYVTDVTAGDEDG
jgi:hypothetical protein